MNSDDASLSSSAKRLQKRNDYSKIERITSLYHYSDLSVGAIADQIDADVREVQKIVDGLVKDEALRMWLDQSMTKLEEIMSTKVASLDYSKSAFDAAVLMADKAIGSVIITKDDVPFGIVTERDIIRRAGIKRDLLLKDVGLEGIASHPLIVADPSLTVEEAADVMLTNKIRKLPIVARGRLLGIVTITDLAAFLSPSRRPGLALSVLRAISRGGEIGP
jgi:CBS domain-containing protein